MAQALQVVDELVRGKQAESVIAVNPEKVIKARSDPYLLGRLCAAKLLIPDGIGIVWAAWMLRLARLERVPGSELMPAICGRAAAKGYSVFLFGATELVNRGACQALIAHFPDLRIAGAHNGYVNEEEMPQLLDAINQSGAQILFVALGSPRQELWMEHYLPKLTTVKICQGVGGTFDVLAGYVRRAPTMLRAIHLEWFYRLVSNPGRLLRQTALPRFAFQVLIRTIVGRS